MVHKAKRIRKPKKVSSLSCREVRAYLGRHPGIKRVKRMLDEETNKKSRKQVLYYLHRRYNELRYAEERKELGIQEIKA